MIKSTTPETDAAEWWCPDCGTDERKGGVRTTDVVPAAFARRLEQERDGARREFAKQPVKGQREFATIYDSENYAADKLEGNEPSIVKPSRSDEQLQLALAKMVPGYIMTVEESSGFWKVDVFYWIDNKWRTSKQRVTDREWPHVCWLIEQSLNRDKAIEFFSELNVITAAAIDENAEDKGALWDLIHATWQQKAEALIRLQIEPLTRKQLADTALLTSGPKPHNVPTNQLSISLATHTADPAQTS